MIFRNAVICAILLFGLAGCGYDSTDEWTTVTADAEENIDFSTYPAITVPVYAYRVSDDDGGNTPDWTAAQITNWITATNTLLADANVSITFDENNNYESINDSLINSLRLSGNSTAAENAAESYASNHADSVTVFVRKDGVGAAYSGAGLSYIALSPFTQFYCDGQDRHEVLAHELGHYLGLLHTFAIEFSTMEEASSYFTFTSSAPDDYDGDGIGDTAADFYVAERSSCSNGSELIVNNTTFNLPYSNVMSYYAPASLGDFTTQQEKRMRETLVHRFDFGLTNIVPGTTKQAFEAESLTVTSGSNYSTMDMSTWWGWWSNDQQLYWAPNTVDEELVLSFTVATAGTYTIYLGQTYGAGFGIFKFAVNGVDIDSTFDTYNKAGYYPSATSIGTFTLGVGAHTLKVTANGKNTDSLYMLYGLDYIVITE